MTAGYDPEIYDLVTPNDVLGDTNWYRELAIKARGPVLELGAGTGRITLELARAGAEIVALDSNQEMLERLRQKIAAAKPELQSRVETVQADMQSFDLERRFALVIVPYRAFLHNLTEQEQSTTLGRVFAHLVPGGMFALNVFHPSLTMMASHSGDFAGVWRFGGEWPLEDGGFLIRSEVNRYDNVRKIVRARHRYERFDARGQLVSTYLQRLDLAYLYPKDLTRLLESAGFEEVTIAGGFDGRPFADDRDELVVTARRPS